MRDKILIALSVTLLFAVGVEGYYLYQMNKQIANKSSYYQPTVDNNEILKQLNTNTNLNPFKEFQKMQEQINKMFGTFNAKFQSNPDFNKFFQNFSTLPLMNMEENGNKYIISMGIPGSKKDKIKINIKNGILKVIAKTKHIQNNKNSKFIQKERYVGDFEREVTLPNDANTSNMKTIYKNGVLKIIILKKQ